MPQLIAYHAVQNLLNATASHKRGVNLETASKYSHFSIYPVDTVRSLVL